MKLFSCVHRLRMSLVMKEQKEAQKENSCCSLMPEKGPAQAQVPHGTAHAVGIADGRVNLRWNSEQSKS